MKNDFKLMNYQFREKLPLKHYFQSRYPRLLKKWDMNLRSLLENRIKVNNGKVDENYIFQVGDILEYKHYRADEKSLNDIRVIYENDDLLAVDKIHAFPVTPNSDYYFNSYTICLREYFKNSMLSPLHRLDMETSGVLIFCKKRDKRGKYQALFENRELDKFYTAHVHGEFLYKEKFIRGKIVKDTGSKILSKLKLIPGCDSTVTELINSYYMKNEDYSILKLKPITGYRNQIRVHLSSIAYPVLGDKKYGFSETEYLDHFQGSELNSGKRLMLHCDKIIIDGLSIISADSIG